METSKRKLGLKPLIRSCSASTFPPVEGILTLLIVIFSGWAVRVLAVSCTRRRVIATRCLTYSRMIWSEAALLLQLLLWPSSPSPSSPSWSSCSSSPSPSQETIRKERPCKEIVELDHQELDFYLFPKIDWLYWMQILDWKDPLYWHIIGTDQRLQDSHRRAGLSRTICVGVFLVGIICSGTEPVGVMIKYSIITSSSVSTVPASPSSTTPPSPPVYLRSKFKPSMALDILLPGGYD